MQVGVPLKGNFRDTLILRVPYWLSSCAAHWRCAPDGFLLQHST